MAAGPKTTARGPFLGVWGVLAAVVAVGCSGGAGGPELGDVSGVVTMDGQPLKGVTVTFEPASGRPSVGLTDDAGRYSLQYAADSTGAVVGPHTVRVTTPQTAPPPPGKPYVDPIPAKYNSQSTLTADVKPGANTFDFPLTSK